MNGDVCSICGTTEISLVESYAIVKWDPAQRMNVPLLTICKDHWPNIAIAVLDEISQTDFALYEGPVEAAEA